MIHKFTKESITEAILLLNLAVEKDPALARAWAELAAAHNISVDFGAEPAAGRAASLSAAQRAVALDPMDANAHSILGHMLSMSGELDRAKAQFESALRLNPGSADVLMIYMNWATIWEARNAPPKLPIGSSV